MADGTLRMSYESAPSMEGDGGPYDDYSAASMPVSGTDDVAEETPPPTDAPAPAKADKEEGAQETVEEKTPSSNGAGVVAPLIRMPSERSERRSRGHGSPRHRGVSGFRAGGATQGSEAVYQDQTAALHTIQLENVRVMRDDEVAKVCAMLREALALRAKYKVEAEHDYSTVLPDEHELPDPFVPQEHAGRLYSFEMRRGIMVVWPEAEARHAGLRPPGRKDDKPAAFEPPRSLSTYTRDLSRLIAITSDAAVNSFCYRRLQKLEARFKLHVMEHEHEETAEQRAVPHRDFYNCRKVDTHVHLAAAMNQKHLLRFIKRKVRYHPDEVVTKNDRGEPMTLQQVFEEMGLNTYDLSIDALGMHTDASTFARFDKFNLKYNPLGKSKLREIFIKTDNVIEGRYFAEITQELFDDLAFSKYQKTEYRISIYGRDKSEWDQLAAWVIDHHLYSPHNRWLIQIPRLYGMYQENRHLRTFAEMLDNIFTPLFEVSVDPSTHPKMHLLLQQVVGFDSVDDESKPEGPLPTPDQPATHPEQWTEVNPHYAYYAYYVYANLQVLNKLRRHQHLSTFDFRPHAGEAGELNHLHAAFLTARGINHGINLRKSPSLQYLYYLTQMGLALSPLSNNALFLQLSKNPFDEFFHVGLNVSLSTDDPLMFHHTREPLMEEYTIAKQVWKLSSVDLSEIARNSVLQSSFEPNVKAFWIGAQYWKGGVAGNDIHRTNVPQLRCLYRETALAEEWRLVQDEVHAQAQMVAPLSPLRTSVAGPTGLAPSATAATALTPSSVPTGSPPSSRPPPPPTVLSPPRGSASSGGPGGFPRLQPLPPARPPASLDAQRSFMDIGYERSERPVHNRGGDSDSDDPRAPPKGRYWSTSAMPRRTNQSSSRLFGHGGGGGRASHEGRVSHEGALTLDQKLSDDGVPPALAARLDAQQKLLESAQAMALAAEERAEAAMRLNRWVVALVVCGVGAVMLVRPR